MKLYLTSAVWLIEQQVNESGEDLCSRNVRLTAATPEREPFYKQDTHNHWQVWIHTLYIVQKHKGQSNCPTFLLILAPVHLFSQSLETPLQEVSVCFMKQTYSRKKSLLVAGAICVQSHPWKGTPGTDEDIWRYSSCHICRRLNTFTSALSLPCALPCIPGTSLWSAPRLLVSQLLEPASKQSQSIRQQQKVRRLTPQLYGTGAGSYLEKIHLLLASSGTRGGNATHWQDSACCKISTRGERYSKDYRAVAGTLQNLEGGRTTQPFTVIKHSTMYNSSPLWCFKTLFF